MAKHAPESAGPFREETGADRGQECRGVLDQRQFEELARLGAGVNEALRLEFIGGRICERPGPDRDRGRIIAWLTRVFLQADVRWWLHPYQGLRVGRNGAHNARPDGSLASSGTFTGRDEWAAPEGVLMIVEVISGDREADRPDRVERLRAYAESRVPVLLLIDRYSREVEVRSGPDGVRYETVVTVPFGRTVTLPAPLGIALDTAPLKDWLR